MYPHDFIEKVELTDYQLAAHDDSVGRTYRYYIEEPLFKFGHGLSLTKFEMSCSADGDAVECEVENVGSMDGDEVVQVRSKRSERRSCPSAPLLTSPFRCTTLWATT
jgi:hypothetical protein